MSDISAPAAIAPATGDLPTATLADAKAQEILANTLRLRLCKTGYAGARGPSAKILLTIIKILRVDVPVQSDFPCSLSLAPFEVQAANVPPKMAEAIAPLMQTLERAGFAQPLWYWMPHAMGIADTVLVHMLHASGQGVVRITCHQMRVKPKPIVFAEFFSEVAGGQMLLTWGRGFELARPDDWVIQKVGKDSPTELWTAHRKKLIEIAGAKPVTTCASVDAMQEFMERRHRQLMQLQVDRGICVPLTPAEQQRLLKRLGDSQTARQTSSEHADVLAEIARMQEKTTNWGSTIFILIMSLVAFVAVGLSREKWNIAFLATLMGVLFVHELGHYIAMRLSGYRNLRMFFIPFLGAAVSGQSYNVAGWKKTLVSLMGPVPGIVLAIPLGIVGVFLGYQALTMVALMALLLNALNLVPVLPLDGGWVLHHVLFSRNVYLEIIFRIVAIGVLLLGSATLGDKFLMYFGIATAVQLPIAFKQARIVARLRSAGFQPVSHDDQTIAPEAAVPIIERVKEAFPKNLSTRMAATHTIAVFDRLNSRPPGWGVSILFMVLHGGTFVVALVCALAFAIGMHGGFEGLANSGHLLRNYARIAEGAKLKQTVSPATVVVVTPPPGGVVPPVTLIADYKEHAQALDAARRIKPGAPEGTGFMVFGQTLMISLPADDDAVRERLYTAISVNSTDGQVRRPEQRCTLSLQFDLPTKAQSHPAATELATRLSGPHLEREYAPWDPSDPRSAETKARAAAVRKIHHDILDPGAEQFDKKAAEEFSKKYEEAIRKGDRAAVRKLTADQEATRKQALLDRLARMEKANPEYAAIFVAVRESVGKSGDMALYKDLDAIVEPYLELMPKEQANPMGAASGSAHVLGKTVFINLTLVSPEHSLPQVMRWFQEHGLEKARYQFYTSSLREEDDD